MRKEDCDSIREGKLLLFWLFLRQLPDIELPFLQLEGGHAHSVISSDRNHIDLEIFQRYSGHIIDVALYGHSRVVCEQVDSHSPLTFAEGCQDQFIGHQVHFRFADIRDKQDALDIMGPGLRRRSRKIRRPMSGICSH